MDEETLDLGEWNSEPGHRLNVEMKSNVSSLDLNAALLVICPAPPSLHRSLHSTPYGARLLLR